MFHKPTRILDIVSAVCECGCKELQMCMLRISNSSAYIPLSHQTPLIKHKFNDKTGKNFKAATEGLSTRSEALLSSFLWLHRLRAYEADFSYFVLYGSSYTVPAAWLHTIPWIRQVYLCQAPVHLHLCRHLHNFLSFSVCCITFSARSFLPVLL